MPNNSSYGGEQRGYSRSECAIMAEQDAAFAIRFLRSARMIRLIGRRACCADLEMSGLTV